MKRIVFYVSDGTGLTSEILGHAMLTQFPTLEYDRLTLPYILDCEGAQRAVIKINEAADKYKTTPIVFSTLVKEEHRELINQSKGFVLDAFAAFLEPLEKELGVRSSLKVGQSHAIGNPETYRARIEAVHFALESDDGGSRARHYEKADIILVGLARTGKTPTSLYLALQFGLFVANYPITDEDFNAKTLPSSLQGYEHKLFGLHIDAERLAATREKLNPDANYSSHERCHIETNGAESFFHEYGIQYLNVTELSVEEISTRILATTSLKRRLQ